MKKKQFSYIGSVNSSSKISKNLKVLNVNIYVVYLAPASSSGNNVCPMATAECIAGCLNTSGRVKMDSKNIIQNARIAKTKYFFENRNEFNDQLFKEVRKAFKKSYFKGIYFSARLNGTSDINPILFKKGEKNILEEFPHITFYDYTKVLNRINLLEKYSNYHLTFSYSGDNWDDCEKALEKNVNVAVIFNVKKGLPLPETFKGYPVIDGDLYDYRPHDPKKVIVGLRWKNIKNKETNDFIKKSKFVIQ